MTARMIEEAELDRARADLAQLETLLKLAIEQLAANFIAAHGALTLQMALEGHPECVALAREACGHLDSALTALQFEDIASQLIASARRHLNISPEEPKLASGSNESVTQHHMESGAIELF